MAANVSSISKALTEGATTIRIPHPFGASDHKTTEAGVGDKIGIDTGLPTPPNSISPYLPAHSLSARARKDHIGSPPAQVDSDIELGDAVDLPTNNNNDFKSGYSTSTDPGARAAHGIISPTLIARDYLPDIVLGKGQVAVKEVISQLSSSLPGFTDIPPAKARRIVVGALETRHGGVDGGVEFEKTGWGRWVGRLKQQQQQPRRPVGPMRTISEDHSLAANGPPTVRRKTSAMKIPGNSGHTRKQRRLSHGSWAADSNNDQADRTDIGIFDQDDEEMRIDADGDRTNRYRVARHKTGIDDETFFSDTDEEDWASMGVDAWRPGSYSGVMRHRRTSRRSRTKSPFALIGQSLPARSDASMPSQRRPTVQTLDFTGVDADAQERDAIEALMKMGSM